MSQPKASTHDFYGSKKRFLFTVVAFLIFNILATNGANVGINFDLGGNYNEVDVDQQNDIAGLWKHYDGQQDEGSPIEGLNFELNGDNNSVDVDQRNEDSDQPNDNPQHNLDVEAAIQDLIEQSRNFSEKLAQLEATDTGLVEELLAKSEAFTEQLRQLDTANEILFQELFQQNESFSAQFRQNKEDCRQLIQEQDNHLQELQHVVTNTIQEFNESNFRGPKGDQGETGANGRNGRDGRDGINGTKGAKGERGPTGYPWASGGCPGVTFQLPYHGQNTDYVKYLGNFPYLQEGTVCMWLEVNDFTNVPSFSVVFSYLSGSEDNEWVLAFDEDESLFHYVEGAKSPNTNLQSLNGRERFHLCAWFSSKLRMDAVYINGSLASSRGNANTVRGGGTLVLGQDQDKSNPFDRNQAFSGNITNVMVWPRVLSDDEIGSIAANCDCPWDYAVALTLDQVELRGDAVYSVYDECPTL